MASKKAIELLIKLQNDTGKTFDEIEKDLKKLDKQNDINDKSSSKMFSTIKSGAAVAVASITTIVASYAALTKQILESNKELIRQASLAGLSAESFDSISKAASNFGATTDDVSSGINDLTNKVQEAAILNSGAFIDTAKNLGLNIQELAKLKPEQIFYKFSDALNTATDAQKKLFQDELGSDALIQLSKFTSLGSEKMKELIDRQKELGAVIKNESRDSLTKLNNALTETSSIISTTFSEDLAKLAPTITKIIDDFNQIPDSFIKSKDEISILNNVILKTIALIGSLKNAFDATYQITVGVVKILMLEVKNAVQVIASEIVKFYSNIPLIFKNLSDKALLSITKLAISSIEIIQKAYNSLNLPIPETLNNRLLSLTKDQTNLTVSIIKTTKEQELLNNTINNNQKKSVLETQIEQQKIFNDTLKKTIKELEEGEKYAYAFFNSEEVIASNLEIEKRNALLEKSKKAISDALDANNKESSFSLIAENQKILLLNKNIELMKAQNMLAGNQSLNNDKIKADLLAIIESYKLINANNASIDNQKNLIDAELALQNFNRTYDLTAKTSYEISQTVGVGLKSAFTDAITGASEFGDVVSSMLDNIINKLIEAALQALIFDQLSKALTSAGSSQGDGFLGSFLTTLGSSFAAAHSGGTSGDTTMTRTNINPAVFAGLGSSNSNLRSKEIPTLLEKGEVVLTESEAKSINNYKNSTTTVESKNNIIENNIAFGDSKIEELFNTDSAKKAIANFINENPDKLTI